MPPTRAGSMAPRRAGDQQLVDPPPVEIDHLEAPALLGEALALGWQVTQHREREPGDGGVIAILGQHDVEPFGERIGGHMPRHQQRAVVALDDRRRLVGVGIDSYVRGWEKPSDHVPVWVDLDLETR